VGSGVINPRFLVLGNRRGDNSFPHWPLHPQAEKDFQYPLNSMVVGFQCQAGRFDKMSLASAQN